MNGTAELSPAYTPQERAALVTFQLMQGRALSTNDVAEQVGVTYHGARAMMFRISRVVPVYEDGGRWRRLD